MVEDKAETDPLIEQPAAPGVEDVESAKENQPSEPPPLSSPKLSMMYLGAVGGMCFTLIAQGTPFCNNVLGPTFGALGYTVLLLSFYLGQLVVFVKEENLSPITRMRVSGVGLGLTLVTFALVASFKFTFRLGFALLVVCLGGLFASILLMTTGRTGLQGGNVDVSSFAYYVIGVGLPGLFGLPAQFCVRLVLKHLLGFSAVKNESGVSPVDTGAMLALLLLAAALAFGAVGVAQWSLREQFAENESKNESEQALDKPAQEEVTKSFGDLFVAILPACIGLALTAFATHSIVPIQLVGWTTKHEKYYPGGQLGYQEMNLFVFQIFSMIGRPLMVLGYGWEGIHVLVCSMVRILFIPLFLASSAQVTFLEWDVVKFALVAFFGLSDGALMLLGMLKGVHSQTETRRGFAICTYITFLFLVSGAVVGTGGGLALNQIPKLFEHKVIGSECSVSDQFAVVCRTTGTPLPGE